MLIQRVPISHINPAPYNPRKDLQPGDAEYEKLHRSLDEFGMVEPLVWNQRTRNLVRGHQRLKVLVAAGETEVDVSVVDLPPEKEKALNLALNRIEGVWDEAKLAALLDELTKIPDFDIELTGFDLPEVEELLAPLGNEGLTDPDAVPEPPDEAVTQPGDLWILGNHRLLCGDAGSAEDVDRLLDGACIHLVNTDPPYNVRVEPRSNTAIAAGVTSFSRRADLQCERSTTERGAKDRERLRKKQRQMHHQKFDVKRGVSDPRKARKKLRPKDRPLEGDWLSDEEYALLLRAWFGQIARVLVPGRCFYAWGGYANIGNYPPALKEAGLYFSQAIIWVKEHPVLTRKDYMGNHEWCFYGWREGAGHEFFGPNNATDVWSVKKVNPASMIHLTQKPIELAVRAIQYSSRPGENVLDLFGGSGSTLIACEQTGRRCFTMELDALYCDVIVQRYEQFTGKKAERIPDPRSASGNEGITGSTAKKKTAPVGAGARKGAPPARKRARGNPGAASRSHTGPQRGA